MGRNCCGERLHLGAGGPSNPFESHRSCSISRARSLEACEPFGGFLRLRDPFCPGGVVMASTRGTLSTRSTQSAIISRTIAIT